MVASGLRLGTPAITSRGMKTEQMRDVAALIARALKNKDDEAALEKVKADVVALCEGFPLYAERRAEGAAV